MERTIVIIGGSRGIGAACVERILKHELPFEPFYSKDDKLTVVFTSRKMEDGDKCLKKWQPNPNLQVSPIKLINLVVDVENPETIPKFVQSLKEHNIEHISVLFANAGSGDPFSRTTKEVSDKTLSINYFGLKKTCEALIPFLKTTDPMNPSRLVITASWLGVVAFQNAPKIKEMIINKAEDASLTEEDIDKCIAQFMENTESKESLQKAGFGPSQNPYGFSKGCLNSLVTIWAKKFAADNINVISVHPGYVQTDLTGGHGDLTASQGSLNVLFPALAKKVHSQTGFFFQDQKPAPMW